MVLGIGTCPAQRPDNPVVRKFGPKRIDFILRHNRLCLHRRGIKHRGGDHPRDTRPGDGAISCLVPHSRPHFQHRLRSSNTHLVIGRSMTSPKLSWPSHDCFPASPTFRLFRSAPSRQGQDFHFGFLVAVSLHPIMQHRQAYAYRKQSKGWPRRRARWRRGSRHVGPGHGGERRAVGRGAARRRVPLDVPCRGVGNDAGGAIGQAALDTAGTMASGAGSSPASPARRHTETRKPPDAGYVPRPSTCHAAGPQGAMRGAHCAALSQPRSPKLPFSEMSPVQFCGKNSARTLR
jgi:hypothetical protein